MVDTWTPVPSTGTWSPIAPPSSDTWATGSSTGVWDTIPPNARLLLTESGVRLRTESDLAILVDYPTTSWPVQDNGSATWTVL